MYTSYPAFSPPTCHDQPLWRYLDLPKFIDLLENSHLFFTRLDQFEDQFEGSIPSKPIQRARDVYGDDDLFPVDTVIPALLGTLTSNTRAKWFVNCWDMNQHESAAMWRLYGNRGLAIRTTFGHLTQSLEQAHDRPIYAGVVQYLDYANDEVPVSHPDEVVMMKRISFEHEHEMRLALRLVPVRVEENGDEIVDPEASDHPRGVYVPVDTAKLVDGVYVSPGRPQWFRELMTKVLLRYGFDNIQINPSSLDERPNY